MGRLVRGVVGGGKGRAGKVRGCMGGYQGWGRCSWSVRRRISRIGLPS